MVEFSVYLNRHVFVMEYLFSDFMVAYVLKLISIWRRSYVVFQKEIRKNVKGLMRISRKKIAHVNSPFLISGVFVSCPFIFITI